MQSTPQMDPGLANRFKGLGRMVGNTPMLAIEFLFRGRKRVLYAKSELLNRQVIGVLNFAPKMVGGFESQVLLTGFEREPGVVVLAQPERTVPNGANLF